IRDHEIPDFVKHGDHCRKNLDAGEQAENHQDRTQENLENKEISLQRRLACETRAVDTDVRERPKRRANHGFENSFEPRAYSEEEIDKRHEGHYIVKNEADSQCDADGHHEERDKDRSSSTGGGIA